MDPLMFFPYTVMWRMYVPSELVLEATAMGYVLQKDGEGRTYYDQPMIGMVDGEKAQSFCNKLNAIQEEGSLFHFHVVKRATN